jgi:hypothetical protein
MKIETRGYDQFFKGLSWILKLKMETTSCASLMISFFQDTTVVLLRK